MELLVDIKKKLPGFILNVKFESTLDVLGLLGASGSGKSMTLRCIAGLEKPDKGRIIINGRTLFDSEKGINIPCGKRKIGFLFQNYALFPNMTVEENIGFALGGLERRKRSEIVSEKIKMVDLEGLEKRYPSQLSGGQQQRVALARALAIEPDALLLDEPFSALDEYLRNHMLKQMLDVLKDYKGLSMFVTHNMEEAYKLCSRLVVLSNGVVEANGLKDDVFGKPSTISTARLTGCKNFSRANFIAPTEVEASDWGIRLRTEQAASPKSSHIGIRAKYIRPAAWNDDRNTFDSWPAFINEGPFNASVYLSLGRKPSNEKDYSVVWDISREKLFELRKLPLPWKIYIDPEKLMIFEN